MGIKMWAKEKLNILIFIINLNILFWSVKIPNAALGVVVVMWHRFTVTKPIVYCQITVLCLLVRWSLIDVITEKLADCTEEQEQWRTSIVAAAIKCLVASYCHFKDQAASPSDQEEGILKRLKQLLVGFYLLIHL